MSKCDFCEKESIGYVSRQLQGPFYCEGHRETAEYLRYLDEVEHLGHTTEEGEK